MDRLTKRTAGGKVVLDGSKFPEYASETLQREIAAFPPFARVIEKLCEYEETRDITGEETA
ncbi:MAG TPA: hypothetical protein IAA61_09000 [Candidatus Ornithomonoglobus merdipullorum]|uniref:Uncharacterized protein n=1 Tax=Candidatus Ornithomonoglobus merdipullorum TaxID=2840895 RepID=A0A9D1MCX2_9FIRM|nr:hypothetical protein [Candidatus Ornithomonoglobus merdipullorum]